MDVQMPDGTIVTGVPDDVTQSALLERYKSYQPPAGLASLASTLPPTSNPLYGLLSRTGSLVGEGIEGVARVAEKVGDKLEGVLPLSNLTAEQIANQRQLEPLFKFAESTKNWAKGINYEPSTKLADLASNPLNAVPFIVERVISSSPDMAASVVAMPAYVAARTNEILNDRLKNDEKKLDDATVSDVTAALGGAIMESTLERFATKHLFKGKPVSGKSATTRVAKEVGIQSGTEGAEEAIGYLAGTVGTKKGVDSKELGESILEGAIVGGGLGGGVRGTREYLDYRKKKQEAADAITKEDEGIIPPIEDTVQTTETVASTATTPAPEGDVAQSREQMLAEFEGRQLPLAEQPVDQTPPVVPQDTAGLNDGDVELLAQVTETQPAQFTDPDTGTAIIISLTKLNDPTLKAGEEVVYGGKTYYTYVQIPQKDTSGQLELAPVNPEGTVIAPAPPVDPNVEARLAAVEPDVEGMIPDEPPPVRAAPPAPIVPAKRIAAEPTTRYGITDKGEVGVPLTEGGKPFQTRKEAEKVQKLQPQLRVLPIKVKGKVTKYVLADKTQKQLAAEKVAAKRLQAIPVGGLLGDILRKGGINPVHRLALGFSEKENPSFGNKRLFAAEGKGIDLSDIVEGQEEGKAAEDRFEGRDIDVRNSLPDRIKAEIERYNAGESEDSVVDAQERKLAEEEQELEEQENKVIQGVGEQLPSNAEFQDYYDVEVNLENPDQSMLDAGFSQQDLNVVGFTKASPELKAEVAALMAQMEALGLETADILAEISFTPNITDLEYYTRAKSELIQAITQAAKQGSGGNVSQANVSASSEGIESPTEEGLKAKQDAIDKAAAEKAKTDRDADAKDKAEEQRKAIAAASEKAAGEFELGKTAEEDLSGQKDIFGGAKQLPELDTTGLKIPKGRHPQVVAAGKLFQAGKMSRADFNAYVDQYTPIAEVPADKIEPPTTLEKILGFFKSPKETERVQKVIPNGTRVGLRMDVPALNAGLPVVSIHEGKANANPKTGKPYASAGSVIKYASTGHIKNVVFAPRSQDKSLDMGLNPTKEPLQTAEGEWVNSTPEETFKRVKELSNDKSWTQVGFDPARHGYFYERLTGEPVASASEVYQVGRFLLAKDVKYAPKSAFLYSKTATQPAAGNKARVLSAAESVSADWEIVPDVVVVDNMQSAEIPQEVKDYDKTQTGGTTKNPEGFYYRGKIYLLASQLKDEADIVRVMNHEVLGHYGLRGLFGNALNPILDQLANARRDLVQERADAYGLDMNNRNDRRQAAEEALAILAQTRPELGFVKRAVAAIRTWLREHGFKNLKLTDDQIINDYIIPARNFIERGAKSAKNQLNDIRYSKSSDQTNTSAFKNWFDGSKVVGADGKPLVVYHNTNADFTVFDKTKNGLAQQFNAQVPGFWFAEDSKIGRVFGEKQMQVYLSLKNPKVISAKSYLQKFVYNGQDPQKFRAKLEREGYDGLIITPESEYANNAGPVGTEEWGQTNYVVFNPTQVKSATSNNGEFDPKNLDIRYSRANEQTNTAAFKKWFGESKMVDENGNPLVLYHGTTKDFTEFRASFAPGQGLGIYFASDPNDTLEFSDDENGLVMPVYLKIVNPYIDGTIPDGVKDEDRFLEDVRYRNTELQRLGFDGIISAQGNGLSGNEVVVFNPNQIKSAIGNTGAFSSESNDIRYSKSSASLQKPKPAATWTAPDMTPKDTFIGKIQDRHISLKRVQQVIEKLPTVTQLQDNLNAYRLEDLAHGRVQVQTDDFLKFEFAPIIKEMNDNKVTDEQLTEYLLNRHAEEANKLIAQRNPNNPLMQDKGSSVETAVAKAYLANLDPAKKKVFESIAKKVDKVIVGTQELLYKNGIISKAELDGWRSTFKYYVPLRREETDYVLPSSSFKEIGSYAKSRTGSFKKVTDILSNVGIAREIAIVRSEKEKAKRAVYGLAVANPNPEFWMAVSPAAVKNQNLLIQELSQMGWDPADIKNIMAEPTKAYFNKDTGLVEHKINTQNRYADFVLPVKINGQDRFVFFNPNDKRSASIITALKNADTQKLGAVTSFVGNITRYFAAVNTQYNLVFGAWNFVRDVQSAMLNLTTTPLNGKQSAVAKGTFSALKDIYAGIKEKNQGTLQTNPADGSWQDFLEAGGKVGYRDQFAKINDTSTLVARELQSLNRGNSYKAARSVLNWVSSVNDTLENAVRLSAYRVALKQNMSKDQAAEIAKNLTVNFNRKGSATAGLSAYYAFLNASIQGTARLAQTIDPRTKSGKLIIAGGLAIGMAQSLALMAAGFDDDEPSEFLKERNLIIPTGWLTGKRTYAMWPMPLGFNILPNTGRLLIDGAARLADGKGVGDIAINALSMAVSSTNPLGGNAATLQSYMPTIADPLVAVYENKDAFGRPIAKEDRGLQPTPGYTRSREPANPIFQGIAEFMNTITSRDKDVKGLISPTADQLSYIAEQVGGGVYREASRAVKYAVNVLNGEETPEHQVPVAGKIIGDLDSNAAISQKFYTNVKNMAEHELVIKAHRDRRESVAEYMRDNPEARLWQRANALENEITKLNKTKKELYQREAPQDRIKRVEEQKIRMMKQFNDQVRRVN